MEKECVLYDRKCIGCGECNKCDLDENKICDNCGKCIDQPGEYRVLKLKDFYEKQKNKRKKLHYSKRNS